MHVGMLFNKRPIKPTDLVVLTVGVVVALLCATDFVTHQNHRHSERKQVDGQEVLDLSASQRLDARLIGLAFDSTVPTAVVVAAVAIVLAVVFTNKSSPGLFKNTNEACGFLHHDDDNSNDCSLIIKPMTSQYAP